MYNKPFCLGCYMLRKFLFFDIQVLKERIITCAVMISSCLFVGYFPVDFLVLRAKVYWNSSTLAWDTCRLPGFFVFTSLPIYLYGSYIDIFFRCFFPNSVRILPCTITPGPFVIPKHTSSLLDLRCNFLQLYCQCCSWKDARTRVTPFQNLLILYVWYSFLDLSVHGQYCIWISRTLHLHPVFFLCYFNILFEIFTIIAFNFYAQEFLIISPIACIKVIKLQTRKNYNICTVLALNWQGQTTSCQLFQLKVYITAVSMPIRFVSAPIFIGQFLTTDSDNSATQ
jgi:hypothetical protein